MLVPGAILMAVVIVFHSALSTFGSPVMAPLGQGLVLNEFIRHFEPAVYDRDALMTQHKRLRRDATSSSPPLSLHIKANSRIFRLLLRPDREVFSPDAVVESSFGRQLNFDPGKVYAGTLEDDDLAEVRGLVTEDGLFDGTISTLLEDFYIEPVSRYVKQNSRTPNFHTIVYRSSDVSTPQLTQPCASQLLHLNNMASRETIEGRTASALREGKHVNSSGNNWNSEINEDWTLTSESNRSNGKGCAEGKGLSDINKSSKINRLNEVAHREQAANIIDTVHKIDRKKGGGVGGGKDCVSNKVIGSDGTRGAGCAAVGHSHKTKRSDRWSSDEASHTADSMYGSTTTRNASRLDTYYYNPNVFVNGSLPSAALTDEVFAVRHVHKRATVDPKKTTCMLYLQADHLFYQKYGTEEACIEVMTRHVQRVNSIYKTTDFNQDGKPDNISFMVKRIKVHSMDALKDNSYRFPLNYGVEKFLELFSEEDYDQFCLAYMFTYRDFEMGTLGLAWTGDLKNAGGVCEKNGHYRGSMKSLNTGIVTLLNYGKHVPPAVSHVTLAHEIGHNFGSPHDPELCTPGGEDGNFIMFARATSGDKRNNNKFSPCSLNSINPVLNAKARSPKGCFTEPQAAICGNGVVEVGEECDCGWEEDCRDECCFPQRRYPPPEEPPCRLTPHSVCSPSQGPCCTTTCELKSGDKCRDDNGCRDASFCDGRGPQCPPSINKPNKTICNEEFVCFMGMVCHCVIYNKMNNIWSDTLGSSMDRHQMAGDGTMRMEFHRCSLDVRRGKVENWFSVWYDLSL